LAQFESAVYCGPVTSLYGQASLAADIYHLIICHRADSDFPA
jgi:hypothetical protein